MDLKSTYNKIAEDWSKDHNTDTWWHEGTDTFIRELPKGASVLDIGCGPGLKSQYLKDHGLTVTGTDFSEKMIDIAKRTHPGIPFEVLDVYDVSTYSKTFDGIFAQAVLLHIPKNKIRDVLRSLKSKLNKNGLLYIAVKGVKGDGIEEKITTENDYGYEYKRFFSFYTLPELETYLLELDMEIVWTTSNPSSNVNWLQIIGKKIMDRHGDSSHSIML